MSIRSMRPTNLGAALVKLQDEVERLSYLWTQRRSLVPSGIILPYGGTTAPDSEWLLCDGSAVSRSTYSALFDVIGIEYGSGNGSTTFNLPDFNSANRFPRGSSSGGGTGGAANHTLTVAEMPAHDHGGETGDPTEANRAVVTGVQANRATTGIALGLTGTVSSHKHSISSQGGGGSHNNLPPYQDVRYIIKV